MLYEDNYLAHFGIKGQRWGIRRFQNEDGSLTEEGKKRYLVNQGYGGNENLNTRGLLHPVMGVKYGAYIRKRDKKDFETKYGKTKEEQKANLKKEDEEFAESMKMYKEARQLVKQTKSFEKMSSDEKKDLGDKVLRYIKNYLDKRDSSDPDSIDWEQEEQFGKLEMWLGGQVSSKSGTDVSVGSVTEASRQIRKKLYDAQDEESARREEIKKQIGYKQLDLPTPYTKKSYEKFLIKSNEENKRLLKALENDSIWASLNSKIKGYQSDWQGVVLRDIGFRDTPENRALIWPYIIEIWD